MSQTKNPELIKEIHDKNAPLWAACMAVLCATGLATSWTDLGDFWRGYVLDITGPAWNYILIRGLFTKYRDNAWRRFFIPLRAFALMLIVAFGIETMQYFKLYDATYDPLDFLAYISLLVPVFILDQWQSSKSR